MNIKKERIRSFVIGSSLVAFIILFIAVIYFNTIEKKGLINYHRYSILAPLWLGIFSLVAKQISIRYNVELQFSYLTVSLISAMLVSIMISFGTTYKFKMYSTRGYLQYLLVFVGHLLIYNGIIYPLDVYLAK